MTTFCCDFERVFSLSELRASSTDIVWRLYHICHSKRFIALAAISLIEFPPPSSLVSLLGKLLSGTEVRDCLWQTSDRNIRLWWNFHHSDKHFVILLISWLFTFYVYWTFTWNLWSSFYLTWLPSRNKKCGAVDAVLDWWCLSPSVIVERRCLWLPYNWQRE